MHRLPTFLLGLVLFFTAPVSVLAVVQPQSAGEIAVPGRLYIQFTQDNVSMFGGITGITSFDQAASRYNVTAIEKAFPSLDVIASRRPLAPSTEALRRIYVVHYDAFDSPRQVAEELSRVPGVRYAEPVYATSPLYSEIMLDPASGTRQGRDLQGLQAFPNDTRYSEQTELRFLNLEQAWDVVKGEDGDALIAIVDGGVFWRHDDLFDNVWTNPQETPGDGVDNDQNGYVDDVHGWNFWNNSWDPNESSGLHARFHGTGVAGAAAAVTDNNLGNAGASWNAEFMGVNISCTDPLQGIFCHHAKGVVYAAMNGADVITASYWTAAYSETDKLAYQSATDEGALVVAEAGGYRTQGTYVKSDNDLSPVYPANYPMVLSVGGLGTHSDDNRFNYGKTVNVFAPGDSIEITVPPFPDPSGEHKYVIGEGISFAVPLVAGVAALVKTRNPQFDAHQLREQIRLTAVNIDHANYPAGKFGRGKVDAWRALTHSPLSPGIRVTEWSYWNQDGNTNVGAQDLVQVRITLTNYHGYGLDMDAELTSPANYVVWQDKTEHLGAMDFQDTREVVYQFSFADHAPSKGRVALSPVITSVLHPGESDSPDLFYVSFDRAFDDSISLSVSPASVAEGDGATTVTVTATSTGAFGTAKTLPIKVKGSLVEGAVDFAAVEGFDLVLMAGARVATATFTLSPTDDLVDETDESIVVSSTSSLVYDSTRVTVTDDDNTPNISLSAHPASVDEGDGDTTVKVKATLMGGTTFGTVQSLPIVVEGSGLPGVVGFTSVTGVVLSVAAESDEDSTEFVLSPTDNTTQDSDELIIIRSSSPLVVDSAKVALVDNDGSPITLSADPASVSEGGGATTITLTATSTTTFTDVQVLPIAVAGSGLAEAVDFVDVASFHLTLPASTTQATATFTLVPTDDHTDERDETLTIFSSNTLVGGSATVTLLDDDAAPDGIALSVAPEDIREDDGATTVTVTATVSGASRYVSGKVMNLTVTGTGVAGAVDFTLVPEFFLTVPAEAAAGTATFVLTPENDQEGEADETLTVSSDSLFVLSDATVIIRDDDGGRTGSDVEAEAVEFGVAPPYPNPASDQITFVLSSPETADWVRLRLYNVLGQEVAVPYEGALRGGQHTVRYDGRHLPAGVYVYVFESRETRITGQLIMAQ